MQQELTSIAQSFFRPAQGPPARGEWVHYRRYVRFLPPGEDGSQWALVLQDSAPREAAERALIAGVDVLAHENPAKSEGPLPETTPLHPSDLGRLRRRICVGRYTYSPEQGRIMMRCAPGASRGSAPAEFCRRSVGGRLQANSIERVPPVPGWRFARMSRGFVLDDSQACRAVAAPLLWPPPPPRSCFGSAVVGVRGCS